jgi:sec-independent protein translocase protein TatA
MFGSIGGPELVVIFVVALLVFGPRKLPEIGKMLGKGLGEFRRAANELRSSLETEVAREESISRPTGSVPAPPALPPAGVVSTEADPGSGATPPDAPDAGTATERR